MTHSYSVAIRTLGTSGWMYHRLIETINRQTIPPEGIFVYLAEGYQPPERVKDEIIVRCPKGMVAQRSLDFKEIHSEYILFCDDDIELEEAAVAKLFSGLESHHGDCISANMYPNHLWSGKEKLVHALLYGELPSYRGKYAFTVRKSSFYSYAARPEEVMETQSFAGGCYLARKQAVLSIHFKDEIWLDTYRYALGDDQLFSYKLFLSGFKNLVHYNSGITHLDAQTGHYRDLRQSDRDSRTIRYIIWYRSIYEPSSTGRRVQSVIAFYGNWTFQFLLSIIGCLFGKSTFKPSNAIHALRDARRWIKSKAYVNYTEWSTLLKSC